MTITSFDIEQQYGRGILDPIEPLLGYDQISAVALGMAN